MSKVIKDLLKLSQDDLQNRITELRAQMVEQKRARAAGELANPHAIKKTRREIAVALTLLNGQEEDAAEKEEA
ncbi:MAG TPA: 50S ribosomal protein L29 [Candidatus Saccharimonadales bacterium]|nr:50S ribosomal protein L29 [Candidatus Saccharimonadales bacterium]